MQALFLLMKKILKTSFLLLIIFLGLLWVFRANIASGWISRQTGVNVVMSQFNPSPWGLTMKGVVFEHPETHTILKIGTLSLDTPLLAFFDKIVNVNKLELDNVSLVSRINKVKLGSFLDFATTLKKDKKKLKIQGSKSASKQFIIKELIAKNIHIEIDNPLGKGTLVNTTLPVLKLKNINDGHPLSLGGLISEMANSRL